MPSVELTLTREGEMNIQEIGREIQLQDNRGVEAPMFIVQEKVRIWGMDSAYSDEYRWINPKDIYNDEWEEADYGMAVGLDDQEHEGQDTAPWRKVYFEDRWEFVNACFTEAGCKAFIAADGHNHGELRIYAAGSYRNAEWRMVRNYLMGGGRVSDQGKECVMPRELTAENGAKWALSGEFSETVIMRCEFCEDGWEDEEAGEECPACGGCGDYALKVPVSWTTIKEIYTAAVDLLSKPQSIKP